MFLLKLKHKKENLLVIVLFKMELFIKIKMYVQLRMSIVLYKFPYLLYFFYYLII